MQKNRSKQWAKTEWTQILRMKDILGVSTERDVGEIIRTLRIQCKCWIVSLKWMNVLLLLILLFYSNRLCVLTSHILLGGSNVLLCIFCILSRFVSISGEPPHRTAPQCLCDSAEAVIVYVRRRDTNTFPRDLLVVIVFVCVFFSFLHVRRKGLRSWFHFRFFRFFFNVNRWHFLFSLLLYNVYVFEAIFFWMNEVWTMNI